MRRKILILGAFIIFSIAGSSDISITRENPAPGTLSVISKDLVAGQEGELLLKYRAGKDGVPQDWRIWVELPAVWYNQLGCPREDRALKWQHKGKGKSGYFDALKLPDGITVMYDVGSHADIHGTGNRFVRVFSFQVTGRNLKPGESMHLAFRHTVKDGRSYLPRKNGSGPIRWRLAMPSEKPPNYNPVLGQLLSGRSKLSDAKSIWLDIAPSEPKRMEVTVPSIALPGEKVAVRVRLLDEYYNLVKKWPSEALLYGEGSITGLPEKISPHDNGVAIAEFEVKSASVVRIRAVIDGVGGEWSNPLEVVSTDPGYRIYWGDVHSHSQISQDGMGVKPFEYARDASALDFFSPTEHVIATTDHEWDEIIDKVAEYDHPGHFDTILALEDSAFYPSGHFNLYFKESKVPKFKPRQIRDVPRAYRGFSPLIIQHHTGIQWYVDIGKFQWAVPLFNKFLGSHVNWKGSPEVRRTAVEIYSLHGSSEMYDPKDPLAYENCDLTLATDETFGRCRTGASANGPHYARDGWAAGFVMGTVSGSDDHSAQPGKRGGGLTAVLATAHTREAIFEAMRARRTYATTGDRIILDFSINGKPMGSVIKPTDQIRFRVKAIGVAPISKIEILRYDWKTNAWSTIVEESPGSIYAQLDLTMDTPAPAVYYLRLEQEGLVRGRPVRAWSSPVWVGKPPRNINQ